MLESDLHEGDSAARRAVSPNSCSRPAYTPTPPQLRLMLTDPCEV